MTRARSRTVSIEEGPSIGQGFGDPPPRPVQYDWAAIAALLRTQPGEWYCVFKQDRSTVVTALRQDSIAALRSTKGFEVRSANNKPNARPRTCDLWLRYVPSKDTEKGTK